MRAEASSASLFFYLLQESSILKSIILTETNLNTIFDKNTCNYLSCQTDWLWLKNVVRIINNLELIPKLENFSPMWSCSLDSKVIVSIDIHTGDIKAKTHSSTCEFICNPCDLRPIPSLTRSSSLLLAFNPKFQYLLYITA
eukprot:TRINITY_DN8267_c0_g1_i3.p1 TRINITY_DN8267_c0_g1~~TRINITY_DN8267_c0_g1_i3.p1  ORF type:complete len:141 (+),score=2.93 TRINITY_DN8267_c0_g1_i3:301-723(+)